MALWKTIATLPYELPAAPALDGESSQRGKKGADDGLLRKPFGDEESKFVQDVLRDASAWFKQQFEVREAFRVSMLVDCPDLVALVMEAWPDPGRWD